MGLVSKGDKRFEARGYGPLVEKAFELKVDEVAGPIKTEKGYHIVKVTRGVELESFDDAKAGIAFKTKGKLKNDTVGRLKKEGSVTFADELKPKKPAEDKKLSLPTAPAKPADTAKPAAPAAEKTKK